MFHGGTGTPEPENLADLTLNTRKGRQEGGACSRSGPHAAGMLMKLYVAGEEGTEITHIYILKGCLFDSV